MRVLLVFVILSAVFSSACQSTAPTVTKTVIPPTVTVTSPPPTPTTTPIQSDITPTDVPTPTTSVSPTATSEIVTPTPVSAEPNTGFITGHVAYTDDSPASHILVYIFEEHAFLSTETLWTNSNGDYYCKALPVGNYEIYAAIYKDYSMEVPDARVTVIDQQVATAPIIIVPREVKFSLGGDYPVDRPLFISWESISDVYKYTVIIESNLEAASPGPIGYKNMVSTSQTNITWPALEAGGYKITIKAYDKKDNLIGIGHDYFTIISYTLPFP